MEWNGMNEYQNQGKATQSKARARQGEPKEPRARNQGKVGTRGGTELGLNQNHIQEEGRLAQNQEPRGKGNQPRARASKAREGVQGREGKVEPGGDPDPTRIRSRDQEN